MIYLSDSIIDQLLLDDILYGDLTTRSLGLHNQRGTMTFTSTQGGCISGIEIALRMLKKLGLDCQGYFRDGEIVAENSGLIKATGAVEALHQGWKAVQNILEWCCGVSHYTHQMVSILKHHQPNAQLACTRKTVPGTKLFALTAILAGGAMIHRAGCAESILLFTNHRNCLAAPNNWHAHINTLKIAAPEQQIIVEADDIEQANLAIQAGADIVQLDKFTPQQIRQLQQDIYKQNSLCRLSAAGGINLQTIEEYAQTGISLFVTSAPYYAPPRDIKVKISVA
ncbi:ModD protein [Providencia stuartii]|uniref:ModD protein n=1 Tax=Providencia stuartii TaxID=588 RepID=UPI001FF6E386|nr:ModD protein [Providencia stuartii]ELZ5941059.1 ModD protein [Providencia stuartii]MCK1143964.1 ModD protein [Providencia stuartii]